MGLIDGIKGKALQMMVNLFAVKFFRDVREGKKGPRLQAIDAWLVGKKTWISIGLGLTAFTAYVMGYTAFAQGVGVVAGFGFTFGFADKAWRNAEPPAWASEALTAVINCAPMISGIAAFAAQALPAHADLVSAIAASITFATTLLSGYLADPLHPENVPVLPFRPAKG